MSQRGLYPIVAVIQGHRHGRVLVQCAGGRPGQAPELWRDASASDGDPTALLLLGDFLALLLTTSMEQRGSGRVVVAIHSPPPPSGGWVGGARRHERHVGNRALLGCRIRQDVARGRPPPRSPTAAGTCMTGWSSSPAPDGVWAPK